MSNLSISNLLSQLQNLTPAQKQQVEDAVSNEDTTGAPTTDTSTGQNVPDSTATTTGATATEGASNPVMSSDMNMVLLQLQESQEMTDAQSLLYGDSSSSGDGSLLSYLNGGTSSSGTTDPTQALLDQLTGTSSNSTLSSSNQTLLDYLNAMDPSNSGDSALGVDTSATAADTRATNPSVTNPSVTADSNASLESIFTALGLTDPNATTSTTESSTVAATQDPLLAASANTE